MILFDTDTCIGILRGYESVLTKRKTVEDEVAISFMTVAELYYGAEKSSNREKNIHLVEQFLLTVKIIHSDIQIMQEFARIKAILAMQGNVLTDADLMIAATCLTKCRLLVTGNIKHYNRIDGLKMENWLR